jgi:hypothetical protein
MDIPSQQVPRAGELNIDHVAYFVADIDGASGALERLGFTLTPFSAQSHRLEAGGPLVPAGSGNGCIMLERGYLETLTPTGDTPIAAQLRSAIERYIGVHLIAFGTAAPQSDHARLREAGFDPLAPVALQRSIDTENGPGTARFTVIRVPPGTMAEGRIQYCQQHTPELVWQRRWTTHRNGATALTRVIVCIADPRETALRYSRFAGLPAQQNGRVWKLATARGEIVFFDPPHLEQTFRVRAPALPWIAGYSLETHDLASTKACIEGVGIACEPLDNGALCIRLPDTLGGIVLFEQSKL